MIDEFYVKKQQLAASQRPALSLSLVRSPGISPSSLFVSHSNMQLGACSADILNSARLAYYGLFPLI